MPLIANQQYEQLGRWYTCKSKFIIDQGIRKSETET